MKSNWMSLAFVTALGSGCVALLPAPANAQGFSVGVNVPGVSIGVGQGVNGYYGGGVVGGVGVYPGYPVVAPGAVVVGAGVPYGVARPIIVPRPIYGPGFYGPRVYGGYRPGPYYYGRRRW